jgi:C-terminal processing protease CtpA/Prc
MELNEVGRYDGTLRVGSLDFIQPIVGLTDDTELVGYHVLKHFVMTFDQKKKRVQMQPVSPSPVQMPSRTGTGALLRPLEGSLEIARIVPGSSAEKVGLEVGDRVSHVDGIPVNERGCRDLGPRTGVVEFTIQRDSVEKTFRLENAVLLQ